MHHFFSLEIEEKSTMKVYLLYSEILQGRHEISRRDQNSNLSRRWRFQSDSFSNITPEKKKPGISKYIYPMKILWIF